MDWLQNGTGSRLKHNCLQYVSVSFCNKFNYSVLWNVILTLIVLLSYVTAVAEWLGHQIIEDTSSNSRFILRNVIFKANIVLWKVIVYFLFSDADLFSIIEQWGLVLRKIWVEEWVSWVYHGEKVLLSWVKFSSEMALNCEAPDSVNDL